MMRLAGHVGHVREMRNAYKILVEKPEGKKPLGQPTNNIKMHLREKSVNVWAGLNWFRIGTAGELL
jgi:hypothetical protein